MDNFWTTFGVILGDHLGIDRPRRGHGAPKTSLKIFKMAETEVRSEGLTLQKIRAERMEAFLKEPQGLALGTLRGSKMGPKMGLIFGLVLGSVLAPKWVPKWSQNWFRICSNILYFLDCFFGRLGALQVPLLGPQKH